MIPSLVFAILYSFYRYIKEKKQEARSLMKRFFLFFFIIPLFAPAQPSVSIIPEPASIVMGKGRFLFSSNTFISFDKKDDSLMTALSPLLLRFKQAAGIDLEKGKKTSSSSQIEVTLDSSFSSGEGYQLVVKPNRIRIEAKTAAGIFYAVQSLLQLLPVQIEQNARQKNISWSLHCIKIEDAPRFQYRGIMLDVARHYMPLEFIKKLIDLLAMQKMNRLHLHLTDSQGWRFESKKYPKLMEIGAYRKGTPLNTTYDYNSRPGDSLYGGYYTQEQLKGLVKYAADRFITIVPEIEMPAHSKAALASYPEFACLDSTGKSFAYPEHIQDEYCTKDETFEFLDNILSEVMDVFPSPYIHIAGDEASKVNWRTCPICQKRMRDEGLKNGEELQSYFIRRIEKFVNSKGRNIIGWDEILQGGLAPNATVMSWTGIEGGIKAAQQQHKVIMTPGEYCYFDHYQTDAPGEPAAIGGLTTLAKTYSYDPVPAELTGDEAKYILGAQGNLWTEFIPDPSKAEYMLFPRSVALAEVDWTAPAKKNYADFISRLTRYLKRLDVYTVNYSRHLFDIQLSTSVTHTSELMATLSGVPDPYRIHYTLDGSKPVSSSFLYTAPFPIKQSCTLTAAVLVDQHIIDLEKKALVLHKAVGQHITLQTPPSRYYNKGGDAAWVNGRLGNDDHFNDDDWLGWNGSDFDGTIHFASATRTSTLHTRFFHDPASGVWVPKIITVQVSDNGVDFKTVAEKKMDVPMNSGAAPFNLSWPEMDTKYLRIIASPYGIIPSGSPDAGDDAWLFVDEMMVE